MYICVFCKNQIENKPIKVYSDLRKNNINYYKCKKCGSIHQIPLPEKKIIKQYYESYLKIKSKMNPGYLDSKQLEPFFKERDKTLLEIGFNINNFEDKMNAELGCANGFFLKYLKVKKIKNIIGIDTSKNLLKSIKLKNIKLYCGDLSAIKNNSIDILYMFNILEHIPDQVKLMKQITTRLKHKGYIIIEVPLSGIISNFFNNKWRFLMPDEHLHIPSKKAIVRYFKQNGFILKGYTRFGSGFTSGTINNILKKYADKFAKYFKIGDRGAFLFFYK